MNRFFTTLNFFGVIALAILCGFQWRANGRLDAHVIALNKLSAEQQSKMVDQSRTIQEDAADLDDFRRRLSLSETQLADTRQKLAERNTEYDQIQNTLKKWIQAVADRDAALKQAGQEIQKLAADRNDAIQKFNDLAGKYNAVVQQTSKDQGK